MESKEKLRLTSMVFGIISLPMIFFGMAVPFAALGIITAFLSKDAEPMQGRAIPGFVMSLIGLIIGGIVMIFAFYIVYSGTLNDLLRQYYPEYYSIFYGSENESQYNETNAYSDLLAQIDNGSDPLYVSEEHLKEEEFTYTNVTDDSSYKISSTEVML